MHETNSWWEYATFYAIYPLGYCGAPAVNDRVCAPTPRIRRVTDDLDRISGLGFNALYLGPIFESGSHGYDTRDYFQVDRRLGTNDDVARLVAAAHDRGIRVVLDAVYNHVGRGFEPFERLRAEGPASPYRDWFHGVDFDRDNRFGDGFVYEGWEGVEELVALNHECPAARAHLLAAARHAFERYGIDGLRLDVAYSLPEDFLDELGREVRSVRPDAWLLGEVIHGDYASYLRPDRLDSITNYECYKGLWSSFNDRNLHEIGHSLRRLFGEEGLLRPALKTGRLPYSFADNHDVDRLASRLDEPLHAFPLYGLLWTMPGLPSVYYGSEYAARGRKEDGDAALRPAMSELRRDRSDLARFIGELNAVRAASAALRAGLYEQLAVESAAIVFRRSVAGESVVVAVNADPDPATVALPPSATGSYECLFGGGRVELGSAAAAGATAVEPEIEIPARGVRLLRRR